MPLIIIFAANLGWFPTSGMLTVGAQYQSPIDQFFDFLRHLVLPLVTVSLGLIGGYLTDSLGRRRILVWSILLYAFSALGAGFATSLTALLVLRCMTFVGVCVEFVAAVALRSRSRS